MRRLRQEERPRSSGRSRSARYVEEEVARMMQHAEDKGSFAGAERRTSRQRTDRRESHATSSHRGDGRRSHEPPIARTVKLEETDHREPLKRRKHATSDITPRSHKENPERYARRIEHQQRDRSPEAKPKEMPRPGVATGSNATPIQRAILRPRPRARTGIEPQSLLDDDSAADGGGSISDHASVEEREILHGETYNTMTAAQCPPWLPDYIRGAMVIRRLCVMNIGGRKEKWYKDWDNLWYHFKDCHHKKATQAAMILHLAEQWHNLTDTHRESGLGWTLQYYDTERLAC
eukprot:2134942-Amphidinium_carterae.2